MCVCVCIYIYIPIHRCVFKLVAVSVYIVVVFL